MASTISSKNQLKTTVLLLYCIYLATSIKPLTTKDIITSVYDLLQYHSSFDMLLNSGVKNASCAEKLYQSKTNLSVFENVIAYSGLSIIDIGKEQECKAKDMAFFFITFNMTYSETSFLSEYFAFLEDSQFFKGICLWKECFDYIIQLLDMNSNPQLKRTLEEEGITNISIFNYDFKDNYIYKRMAYKINYKMKSLAYIVWSFAIYIFFRILMTIMTKFITENKKESIEEDKEISSMEISSSFHNNISSGLLPNKIKINSNNKSVIFVISKYCSLKKSFSIIMKKQSKYYNPKDIFPLNGLRFFAMLLITICHNSWAICKLPHKELSSLSSYNNSLWFALIKCGILSFESLKVINGIHFGFKFMSYIKIYSDNDRLSLGKLIRFYLKIVPTVVMFTVALVLFHFYIMEIGLSISPNISYEYYTYKSLMTKDCIKNPLHAFIPFYYQYYISHTDPSSDSGCFKNIFFALSEFYCFTFLCCLVYVLLKIRSKLLDIIVFISSMLLFFLCYVSHQGNFINSNYTLSKVYGSINSFLYPHIFFILYFIGFNLGVMFYYFKDIENVNGEDSSYQLFGYNYNIMKKYTQFPIAIKLIIFFVSLVVISLIVFDYNIIYAAYGVKGSILIKTNRVIEFVFIYEGHLFGVAFILLVMVLLLNSGDLAVTIKSILGTKLFIPIDRINTAFFLMDNFYVSVFHAIYSINIYMNFKNTIFISFPLFIINLFCSIIMVVLIELPMRVIFRKIFISKVRRKAMTLR